MGNSSVRNIVKFWFQYGAENPAQICCCWESDYNAHGKLLVINPAIMKGISDVLDEALEDFKFNLQIANLKNEFEQFTQICSSSCVIREVDGGVISLC